MAQSTTSAQHPPRHATLRLSSSEKGQTLSARVPLDCGNSGSTMRMLAGVLAGQNFDSELTGDDSLRERPMRRIIEPLGLMGASIHSEEGRPPLTIGRSRGRITARRAAFDDPPAAPLAASVAVPESFLKKGRS